MTRTIQEIAQALMVPGKGILAADESTKSMNARLRAIGVYETVESARAFRELLFTTPGIENYISGVILYDETIRQNDSTGKPFPFFLESKGIIPGIKVDRGLVDVPHFPGEKVSEGLDGLEQRLSEYYGLGARFTKWRVVVPIGNGIPTEQMVAANMHTLARYALVVQSKGMVPIVEPEVLYDGTHTLEESASVLSMTLEILFDQLYDYRVAFDGLILKTAMALPGKDSGIASVPADVARETVRVLVETVPPEVAGVVFLSGGQTPVQATANLQAIALVSNKPWPVTFSYSRALQEPALDAWHGDVGEHERAQEAFLYRVRQNVFAREGRYTGE